MVKGMPRDIEVESPLGLKSVLSCWVALEKQPTLSVVQDHLKMGAAVWSPSWGGAGRGRNPTHSLLTLVTGSDRCGVNFGFPMWNMGKSLYLFEPQASSPIKPTCGILRGGGLGVGDLGPGFFLPRAGCFKNNKSNKLR